MSQLKNPPAEIVAQLLIDLGLVSDPELTGTGTDTEYPIYISFMPDTVDEIITIYDTAGELAGRDMPTGHVIDRFGIQIICRSGTTKYTEGQQTLADIADSIDESILDNVVTLNANSYLVRNLRRTSSVLSLGKESEETKRNLLSLNLLATISQL